MQSCRVSVTPKTGRIAAIVATTKPFDSVDEAQKEAMLAVALLKEKYLLKFDEIEQPSVAAGPKPSTPGTPKPATPPPAPKPTTAFKVRRAAVESPFPTDVSFKQGNRTISTELVALLGTLDQTTGKPTVQISYTDQDMMMLGTKERQELEKEHARAWMEEQSHKTDASGL
jgi:cell division septation protein DedD